MNKKRSKLFKRGDVNNKSFPEKATRPIQEIKVSKQRTENIISFNPIVWGAGGITATIISIPNTPIFGLRTIPTLNIKPEKSNNTEKKVFPSKKEFIFKLMPMEFPSDTDRNAINIPSMAKISIVF